MAWTKGASRLYLSNSARVDGNDDKVGTVYSWDDAHTWVKVAMPGGRVEKFPIERVECDW